MVLLLSLNCSEGVCGGRVAKEYKSSLHTFIIFSVLLFLVVVVHIDTQQAPTRAHTFMQIEACRLVITCCLESGIAQKILDFAHFRY